MSKVASPLSVALCVPVRFTRFCKALLPQVQNGDDSIYPWPVSQAYVEAHGKAFVKGKVSICNMFTVFIEVINVLKNYQAKSVMLFFKKKF